MRIAGLLAALAATALLASAGTVAAELTAGQIVAKNAAARGGVEAWRRIQTMAWIGHVESEDQSARRIPFNLEQQRPNRTRFEIVGVNQRSVRVYDGKAGWNMRPGEAGIPEVQPYTAEELNFARDAEAIDGPLMDGAARGGKISLLGAADLDGRKNYVLKVTLPTGATRRVWVDAETFLESRYERDFQTAAGQPATAAVRYRDYRPFEGLQLPVTIETSGMPGKPVNRLVIEKIALNPPLDERMFTRPDVPMPRHHGVLVDTRDAASAPATGAVPPPNAAPAPPAAPAAGSTPAPDSSKE
jgi:outer membrane lipoprotein-sorting protein